MDMILFIGVFFLVSGIIGLVRVTCEMGGFVSDETKP